MAMACPSVGDWLPLVTAPTGCRSSGAADGVAMTGDAAIPQHQADKATLPVVRPPGPPGPRDPRSRGHRPDPSSGRGARSGPARPRRATWRGRARCRRGACRPPVGGCRGHPVRRAAGHARAPASCKASQAAAAIGPGHEQLEAVLARVAGPSQEARDARDARLRRPVRGERTQVQAREGLEDGRRRPAPGWPRGRSPGSRRPAPRRGRPGVPPAPPPRPPGWRRWARRGTHPPTCDTR